MSGYIWFDEQRAYALVDQYIETKLVEHPDYYFDREIAARAVDFIPKHLNFWEGKWAGKPFILEEWQAVDIVIPTFGWKNPDGTRRYREVIVWIPKKNGKSTLAAAILWLVVFGDLEAGGQVYTFAEDKTQAQLVYNMAFEMASASPSLSKHLEFFADSIFHQASLTNVRALANSQKAKDGKGASLYIGDEMHGWKSPYLYDALTSGTAAREQPLGLFFSTYGIPEGYGYEFYEGSKDIYDGVIDAPEILVVIYAADDDCDVQDINAWKQANPNYPISPSKKFVENRMQAALRNEREESEIKRKNLNVWTGQVGRWLNMAEWDKNTADLLNKERWKTLEYELLGQDCYGMVDLASVKDINAVVYLFPPKGLRDRWAVICRFYMPKISEKALIKRERLERVKYRAWGLSGAINITDGNCADFDLIEADIIEDSKKFNIKTMGYDSWQGHTLSLHMMKAEMIVEEVTMGFRTLSPASKRLEMMLAREEIDHGNHPVLKWMAATVKVQTDAMDNIKPSKEKREHKIDGITSLVGAIALSLPSLEDVKEERKKQEKGKSYLEYSDLVVL